MDAATAGAFELRQNIRLLDNVIKLGVEGWLRLIEAGRVFPQEIDWLLCHYSSHFFRGQIVELMEQAGCMIHEKKWLTNLYRRGNTGCAAIWEYILGGSASNSQFPIPNYQLPIPNYQFPIKLLLSVGIPLRSANSDAQQSTGL